MKKILSCLLCFFIFIYFLNCITLVFSFLKENRFPEPTIVRSDGMLYLKVFYLVKSGKDYYEALPIAFRNDARQGGLTKDPFMWRPPTVYYFWRLFASNGSQIAILFWLGAFLSFYGIFLILKKFIPWQMAVFGPLLVSFYFRDVFSYATSFLFHEWWGWFAFIFALLFLIYDKLSTSVLFSTLSILTREIFIIPVLAMFIYSLLLKKNRIVFFIPIFIFGIFYLIHVENINNYPLPKSLSFSHYLKFNKIAFLNMTAFSMRKFPLINFRSNIFLIAISFISTFFCVLRIRRENMNYLLLSFWSLLLVLPFAAQNYNDYWGITFMPTLIGFSPLIFVPLSRVINLRFLRNFLPEKFSRVIFVSFRQFFIFFGIF